MPNVTIQSVESFSSEDANFPASNLLAKEARKWKCREPGEKSAFVVLRLEKTLGINGIDIGNEHSAFIEVLVGKSGPANPEFKEILLTCSFMTPIESRNSTSANRVRCFAQSALIDSVAKEKWDLVKIICTQPFNSRVQYGISFIKLHTANVERKDKSLVPEKFQKQIQEEVNKKEAPKILQLGRFTVREESPDSDGGSTSGTALFARWKESRGLGGTPKAVGNSPTISTATAIRNASTPTAIKRTQSTPLVKKHVAIVPKTKPRLFDDDDEEIVKPINRNRDSILYDKDDEKPNEKLEKKLAEDRARQQRDKDAKNEKEKRERSLSEKKEKLHDTSATKFKNFLFDDPPSKQSSPEKKSRESDTSTKKVDRNRSRSPPPAKPTSDSKPASSSEKHERRKHESSEPRHKNGDRDKKHEHDRKKRPSESSGSKERPASSGSRNSASTSKRPKLNFTDDEEESGQLNKKRLPTYKPFNKLLENVVLVISGIQNPDRGNLRSQALAMGAKYKSDWDSSCTHLICAFKNTPKYNQVHGHGKIVKKDWIERCHSLRKRLSWRKFAMDSDEAQQTDSEGEIIDISSKPKAQAERSNEKNGSSASRNERSSEKTKEEASPKETDEEALAHYDLDDVVMVEDKKPDTLEISDSDTEEEIERVKQNQKAEVEDVNRMYDKSTEDEGQSTIAEVFAPLDFFKGKTFFLDDDVGAVDLIKLERYVKIYKGSLTKIATEADYVVTRVKKAMPESFKGELIKPLWIYECHDMECIIPSQRYRL